MFSCCFKISLCRKLCGATDKIGCVGEKLRTPVLAFDAFIMFIALILVIVGMFGFSSTGDVIKTTSWAYVENDYFKTHTNLWGIVVSLNDKWDFCNQDVCVWFGGVPYCREVSFCRTLSWEDVVDRADDNPIAVEVLQADQYSEDCKDASDGCEPAVIILLITSVLSFLKRIVFGRWIKEKDVGRKCISLLTTLLPVVTNIGTLSNYYAKCVDALNDTPYDQTFNATTAIGEQIVTAIRDQQGQWSAGPGYWCLFAALVIHVVSFIINLMVPASEIPVPGADSKKGFSDVEVQGRA